MMQKEKEREGIRRLIVMDLEATCCDQDSVPRAEREIIEIGAVCMELSGDAEEAGEPAIRDVFEAFVRPVRHPGLTAFCMGLTGIRQEDLDDAAAFPEVNRQFAGWITRQQAEVWGSWGFFDRRQYRNDCRFHEVPSPLPEGYRNIKEEFMKTYRQPRRAGVGEALKILGLEFQGRPHRAGDDARNIARIAVRLPLLIQH